MAEAANSVTQDATGNPYADGVLSGTKWRGALTFSFPQSATDYPVDYGSEPTSQFAPISVAQQNVVRAALTGTTVGSNGNFLTYNSVSAFTNLDIREARGPGAGLDGSGDIRLAESDKPSTAYASYPYDDSTGRGGDIWFGIAYAGTSADYRNPLIGNYAYQTALHELGHALGLKHSQEDGGPGNTAVPADRDAIEFSTMAYRSYIDGPIFGYTYEQFGAPQTFMMIDIIGLQSMYGANYTTHAGDTTYRWDPGTGEMFVRESTAGSFVGQGRPGENRVFLTTWDGGGIDTYDLSNYETGVSIDLRPGQWSITSEVQRAYLGYDEVARYAQGNVYNAYLFEDDPASLIDNAVGGRGRDTIVGNQADNVLTGGREADTLTGAAGFDIFQDTAAGLAGDTITDFSSLDSIHVTDAVAAVYGLRYSGTALSFRLAADAVQTYTITLSGAPMDGTLMQQADLVRGGVAISFSPVSPGLIPTVMLASASDTGASNGDGITNLTQVTVTGSGRAGYRIAIYDDSDEDGIQDSGEGTLGTALVAAGATTYTTTIRLSEGAHALRAYQIDPAGTRSSSSAPAGVLVDTTAANVSVSIGDSVLTAGETGAVTFQFSEAVSGFDLGDVAAARGTLSGFTRVDDDTYAALFTPQANYAGPGSITVSAGRYADLAGNAGGAGTVEFGIRTLPGPGVITGTRGNDTLMGTPGDDTIDGRTGADRMHGYAGDDTYVVDNAGDVVVELAGDGTDTVRSTISTVLGANLENLILFDRDTIDGTGNALDNTLTGTSGRNILNGGLGADTMIGGGNNDTYVVDNLGDRIVELEGGGSKDLVRTDLAAYSLGANVEELTYTGSGRFFGSGNALDNTLTGGAGADRLDGAEGGDRMIGGAGDDIYVVDAKKDVVTEAANAGTDTVETTLSKYTLGKHVENLTFVGEGDFRGVGNASANLMTGGAGADTLDGNAGADTLVGGAGDDTFVFHFGEADGDRVVDFSASGSTGDRLEFVGYGEGTLTRIGNTDNFLITPDAEHGGADLAETIALAGATDLWLQQWSTRTDDLFI